MPDLPEFTDDDLDNLTGNPATRASLARLCCDPTIALLLEGGCSAADIRAWLADSVGIKERTA